MTNTDNTRSPVARHKKKRIGDGVYHYRGWRIAEQTREASLEEIRTSGQVWTYCRIDGPADEVDATSLLRWAVEFIDEIEEREG